MAPRPRATSISGLLPFPLPKSMDPGAPPRDTIWDFTPFLSAPAVVARSIETSFPGSKQVVNLINIPQTLVPSPLANDLSPADLISTKKQLVGEGGEGARSGEEIWLSWKRAWDIWNGYYIEGRVNPIWIRSEWERREAARRQGKELDSNGNANGNAEAHGSKSGGSTISQKNVNPNAPEVPPHPPGPHQIWQKVRAPGVGGRRGQDMWHLKELDSSDHAAGCEPNAADPSGGFEPLKRLKEYYEPTEEEFDGNVWVDAVTNTVWTPRRVGETNLKIEVDTDLEEFLNKTEFRVDGGVDCSRTPFPVLRSVVDYFRTKEDAFRKKKFWDGVTGTIFNVPTQPAEVYPETADESKQHVGDMYQDSVRDNPRGRDLEIFPLDIRRVLKVRPDLEAPANPLGQDEAYVLEHTLYPVKRYRQMEKDDPWYVTHAQKTARDAPPRRHPPQQVEFSGKLLPIDGQIWEEECMRDLNRDDGYFVTNLHGGTLVINGMEVNKGDVAGPLPDFAVIECPGGQSVFWWGSNGRHYGERWPGHDFSDKWEILRRHPAWPNVAKPAGQMWDEIMADREKREKTGKSNDDDEQWALWKNASHATPGSTSSLSEPQQLGRYGPMPNFSPDDGTEELKWLMLLRGEKANMSKLAQQAGCLTIPEKPLWSGNSTLLGSREYNQSERDTIYRSIESRQQMLQDAVNERVRREIAEQQAQRTAKEIEQSKVNKKRPASFDAAFEAKRRKTGDTTPTWSPVRRGANAYKATQDRQRVATKKAPELQPAQEDQTSEKQHGTQQVQPLDNHLAKTIQNYWDVLAVQFRRERSGTSEKIQAAKNVLSFHTDDYPFKKETLVEWKKTQTAQQSASLRQACHAAKREVDDHLGKLVSRVAPPDAHDGGRADLTAGTDQPAPTTLSRKPRQWPTHKLRPSPPKVGPPVVMPPTTVDLMLQKALEEKDTWDPELSKAIQASIDMQMTEAKESLIIKAAMSKMSVSNYVKSEGFANEKVYLAAQLLENQKALPPKPDREKTRTEWAKDNTYLEYYKEQLREAIRPALKLEAKLKDKEGSGDWDAYARSREKVDGESWVREKVDAQNIELKDIPSRKPKSKMTAAEVLHDEQVWKKWRARIFDKSEWNARIAELPKGPDYSPPVEIKKFVRIVKEDGTLRNKTQTKRMCEV